MSVVMSRVRFFHSPSTCYHVCRSYCYISELIYFFICVCDLFKFVFFYDVFLPLFDFLLITRSFVQDFSIILPLKPSCDPPTDDRTVTASPTSTVVTLYIL
jgi:hypothetical protein